jgi:hypothetical protein
MDSDVWAEQAVLDLLKKNPPAQMWRGTEVGRTWFWARLVGHTWFDSAYSKMVGLDVLARKVRMHG